MRYGFEREFLVMEGENLVHPQMDQTLDALYLPLDGDGLHVEARGTPHEDPFQAWASMVGVEAKLTSRVLTASDGLQNIYPIDWVQPSKEIRDFMRRHNTKEPLKEHCLYGMIRPPKKGWSAGGLHIHFGVDQDTSTQCRCGRTVGHKPTMPVFDIPRMVRALDKEFAKEIKAAKRQPGRYEIKAHGFEYRSLPASLNPYTVAKFIYQGGLLK